MPEGSVDEATSGKEASMTTCFAEAEVEFGGGGAAAASAACAGASCGSEGGAKQTKAMETEEKKEKKATAEQIFLQSILAMEDGARSNIQTDRFGKYLSGS